MSNFQEHTGFLPAVLWQGQIVDDVTWKGNIPGAKWSDPITQIPGFGFRYKVRIFGRDTSNKNDIPDDQLEMASVLYPVTGGSGHAGSFQTPNLRKGAYVVGYYADGSDGREPIILGTLGNNDQIKLSQTIPQKGFTPYSGYINEKVAGYSIPPGGSGPVGEDGKPQEGVVSYETWLSTEDQLQLSDGKKKVGLLSTSSCKDNEIAAASLKIESLQKDILEAQKFISSWTATVEKPIKYNGQQLSIQEYIALKIFEAAQEVAKPLKKTIKGIKKSTKQKLDEKFKKTYHTTPPNKLPQLKKQIKVTNKLLDLAFDKIIDKLPAMLLKFLADALGKGVGKIINTPACTSQNIIGGILGSVAGFITGTIKKITAPIANFANSALGLISDVLSFIQGLLGYDCPKVTEWSWWKGPVNDFAGIQGSAEAIFNKAKNVASQAAELADPDNYDFDINPSDLLDPFGCNTDPKPCGPPKVKITGGSPKTNALANAVVNSDGQLVGVDVVDKGSGYKTTPIASIQDDCGNTPSTKLQVIMTETDPDPEDPDTPLYELENIIVVPDSTGNFPTGSLPSPDGSTGGGGSVFSKKCDATIKKADGTWDKPYEKGEIMNIEIGDTVKLPGQDSYVSEVAETITSPGCVEEEEVVTEQNASVDDGKVINKKIGSNDDEYAVTLSMCEIYINNPGLNYSENDELVIEPANGAKGEIVLGSFGSIEKVNLSQCGKGYTEVPQIYIKTETGYNVSLSPVFTVETVEDILEVPAELQDSLISVIDCVGKF